MQATGGIPASLSDSFQALILLGFAVRYAPQIAAIARRAVRSISESLSAVAAWGRPGSAAGSAPGGSQKRPEES